MDGVAKGELVVDRRLLMVACLVVDDAQVDVGEEFSSDICDFLMPRMVVNGVTIVLRFVLSQLHVVNSNAVVCQSLAVDIADGFAHLEELLVRLDGQLELPQVVVKNAGRVVSAALISRLARPSARKGKDIVVLQSLLGGDSVVRVSVAHLETSVLRQHLMVQLLRPAEIKKQSVSGARH